MTILCLTILEGPTIHFEIVVVLVHAVYFGSATESSPQHLQPVWGCRRLLDVIFHVVEGFSSVLPIWLAKASL